MDQLEGWNHVDPSSSSPFSSYVQKIDIHVCELQLTSWRREGDKNCG